MSFIVKQLKYKSLTVLLDISNSYVSKGKLSENVKMIGGGDWDFSIHSLSKDEVLTEDFYTIVSYSDSKFIKEFNPTSWNDVCDYFHIRLVYEKDYFDEEESYLRYNKPIKIFGKKQLLKQQTKASIERCANHTLESIVPFDSLKNWSVVVNDGNFSALVCEDDKTYYGLQFATS